MVKDSSSCWLVVWHISEVSSMAYPSSLPSQGVTGQNLPPERFNRLMGEWKEQSRFLSNSAQMAMLPAYQRIIGMGAPVVPLILAELSREPDQWFWALEAITEENPVPREALGNVNLMAKAWIEWGEREGILKHGD
jgi:hypothetical protein